MIKKILFGSALMLSVVGQPAMAEYREEFCLGFEEGYKMTAGARESVPGCPMSDVSEEGSTPFREGIKAGMELAKKNYSQGYGKFWQTGEN